MTRLDRIEVLAAQVHAGSEKGSAPEQLAEEVQELAALLREWAASQEEYWTPREHAAARALLAALRDSGGAR